MERMVVPLVLLLLAGAVAAEDGLPADPLENPWLARAGFLSQHPEWAHRLYGYESYRQGRHADAFESFRRAGFYADKPSQAMIAETYRNGVGVPRDRALAYAWMDLAAEGGYAGFLRLRERYWHRLDAAERKRALEEERSIYARFGDAAARPRQERQLRMALRNVVGSRTGFAGNGKSLVIGVHGGVAATIDHTGFYDRQFREPKRYWEYQDRVQYDIRTGRGSAGDLETVEPPAADAGTDATAQDERETDASPESGDAPR